MTDIQIFSRWIDHIQFLNCISVCVNDISCIKIRYKGVKVDPLGTVAWLDEIFGWQNNGKDLPTVAWRNTNVELNSSYKHFYYKSSLLYI